MELTAAIEALESLKQACDSERPHRLAIFARRRHELDRQLEAQRVADADRKPVKNEDLWRRLDAAAQRHEIEWFWVRGHADDELNARADKLAREGMKDFQP